MKKLLALVCCVLSAVALHAQAPTPAEGRPPAARTDAPAAKASVRITPEATQPEAHKKAVAAQSSGKKAEPQKKVEPPKIPGVEVPRASGGFLGVQIIGSAFKISFFDAQKKPVPPDATRAVLRWDPKYKVGKDRVVLNADADSVSLSSPRAIRPPYNFKLFITLIKEAKETADTDEPVGESYTIDFKA